MERIVEPELMDDEAQADFEQSHSRILEVYDEIFAGSAPPREILDLGCGPGDVSVRFAKRFPQARVTAVDGASEMIRLGLERIKNEGLEGRVELIQGFIPGAGIPARTYDLIISTSFLHHLHRPAVLWETISGYSAPVTRIFIVDLRRPASREDAHGLVEKYSGAEPEILKRDFFNSLCAAFTPAEVEAQINSSGLKGLKVLSISDRHLCVVSAGE